jgi:predicted TIM-barrel fold metal-dependent hydrolase
MQIGKRIREQLITLLIFLMAFLIVSCTGETDKSNSNGEKSQKVIPRPEWMGDGPIIIDANIGLGRFANGVGAGFAQTEKAIEHLRAAGINGALVYSVLSRETDAEEGNKIVLEECEKHPELFPSCVINPYEMDIDSALALMQRFDIRIARFFPVVGHYSVFPSIVGPVVEKLQNADKVLIIDYEASHWSSNAIEYDAIYQLCKAYPTIPVILIGSTITGTRNYPNLMAECKNLYLEISQMLQPEGIEKMVRNGYGKRLIFGSGFPLLEPASMLNMLAYSGISQEELHDICSGNILRLLGIRYENDSFSLKPPARRDIIDLHVHHGKINPVPSGTETAEGIIRNMDRCGIKAAVLTSVWSCFGEVKRGNKAVSEGCARYPGRLYGYLTLDPKYPEEVQSELALYGDNPAFRGIKLHALHDVDIADQRHDIIFSFADKKRWFLLCHASSDPAKWEKICSTYKNANFIVAHTGAIDPTNPATVRLAELTGKCKNLYLDCGSSSMTPGALDRLAAIAGADHLTYGSDFPMFDFGYETGRIFSSSLNEEDKNLILYGNAKKLLGL